MNARFDYTLKVTYTHGGVELIDVEQKQDAAEAIMVAMKAIRAKVRRLSVSRPVATVEVVKVINRELL